MTRLTSAEIKAIRKRAEKATEGPWKWAEEKSQHDSDMPVLTGAMYSVMNFGNCETYYPTEGTPPSEADAEFIAKAREDIPKLLTEVEHLTGVIGTLRSKLQLIDGCTYGVPNELTKGAIRYADEELR